MTLAGSPPSEAGLAPRLERSYDYVIIDNQRVRPEVETFLEVVSPVDGKKIGYSVGAGPAEIDLAVRAARRAFDVGPWPRMSVHERRKVLLRAADLLDPIAGELTKLATAENGALFRNRAGYISARIRYFASLDAPAPEVRVAATGETATIVHEPVGVVAAIVPWNAPIALSVTKMVPAMLAGCTVVLKPAPETPLTAYPLAEAFLAAGLPPGVLNVVPAGREASELLVRHPGVDHVSFTGSTATGKRVAALCAEHVKRVKLELGGKSPAIILDDANLEEVAPAVIAGGMLQNSGQACCAWTRILVPKSRYDEALAAFVSTVDRITVGDPFDPATDLGPMISSQHRDKVEGYVRLAEQEGAVAIRGTMPTDLPAGFYTPPVLLARSTNQMRASREEIFGPVVSLIPYDDVDDAISIANDSTYGLSAGIFTGDYELAGRIAARLRIGTVGINSVAFNVEFPLGGYKESGIGRQHGPEGLIEFFEVKSVAVRPGDPPAVVSEETAQ